MVKVGLKWYKMIHNFPKWSDMVKYDLVWSYMVQMLFVRSLKWVGGGWEVSGGRGVNACQPKVDYLRFL